MRELIIRIGAAGAGGLLVLGFLAGPSAASGSDKQSKAEKARESNKVTCFEPEGNTQGRSLSDPDGNANSGADKPGCTGGVDPDDRDGNNGCGNDVDREDDNNGNCGRNGQVGNEPPQGQGPGDEPGQQDDNEPPQGQGPGQQDDGNDGTVNAEDTDEGDVSVQGAGLESESATPAAVAADTTTSDLAAVTAADDTSPAAQTAPPEPEAEVLGVTLSAPDTLARTGAGVGGLALLGGLLVAGGRLTVLARKLLRIG